MDQPSYLCECVSVLVCVWLRGWEERGLVAPPQPPHAWPPAPGLESMRITRVTMEIHKYKYGLSQQRTDAHTHTHTLSARAANRLSHLHHLHSLEGEVWCFYDRWCQEERPAFWISSCRLPSTCVPTRARVCVLRRRLLLWPSAELLSCFSTLNSGWPQLTFIAAVHGSRATSVQRSRKGGDRRSQEDFRWEKNTDDMIQ